MEKNLRNKKLLAYSVMAGAVLAGGENAEASVWRSGELNLSIIGTATTIIFNGNPRFKIKTATQYAEVCPMTNKGYFDGTFLTGTAPNIFPISSEVNSIAKRQWVKKDLLAYGRTYSGTFRGKGDQYIGVKFNIGTDTHYGWLLVNVPSKGGPFTLKGYAYEQTPGGSIGCSGGVLPVELTAFTANLSGNNMLLHWKTATETNNYGFEVERNTFAAPVAGQKEQTSEWEKIAFIGGHGNSNSENEYIWTDANAPTGLVMYRLKQIDKDGKFTYSPIVSVNNASPANFSLKQNYPNPFNPTTTILYSIAKECKVSITVFDMGGAEVATLVNENKEAGNYLLDFNAAHLPSGTYFYKLSAGDFTETKKLMLIK